MELRGKQPYAIQAARDSIAKGLNRPILACPTGFGKTVIAAQMMKNCQDRGKIGWFFCDRKVLIAQTIEKFREFGIDFGVRQAQHELHNPAAPIQIASIQTIQAMVNSHGGRLPIFDFAIVDECHLRWGVIESIVEKYNNVPIVGLSATPYSKGLGKTYNNLIVPATMRELMNQGYLTPIKYYGGAHIDLSKLKSSNPNAYSHEDLEKATEQDKERLTGDIVKNWMQWAKGLITIAFSPSLAHSKYLVQMFNDAGVSAEHIDCYMADDEKNDLMAAHDNGEFMILSCSRLLGTGYDSPNVRALIDCYPTKSIITYVQRAGRICRLADNKEYSVYLDHAGNFEKFGYAEDIYPERLDDGEKTHKEADLVKKKDKKEAKVQECPQCMQQMQGMGCRACGYEVPKHEQIETDNSMLKELTVKEGNKANKNHSKEQKSKFYYECLLYGLQKEKSQNYAKGLYKSKYGVWPRSLLPPAGVFTSGVVESVSAETLGFIKSNNIRYANSKRKAL